MMMFKKKIDVYNILFLTQLLPIVLLLDKKKYMKHVIFLLCEQIKRLVMKS